MTNIFLFGSLRDAGLLECVLGHAPIRVSGAHLPGYRVARARGQAFPLLCKKAHRQGAEGLLLQDLDAREVARLDFYEGAFGYRREPCEVETAQGMRVCETYRPASANLQPDGPWSLETWQAEWAPIARRAAVEAMGYFGQISGAELGHRMLGINLRAASWLRGSAPEPAPTLGREMRREQLRVLAHRVPYCDFFQMQEFDVEIPRFAGGFTPEMTRAVFTGSDAVIVLPYDPRHDLVLLVEQFRAGCYGRGAGRPWSLEPVAGHVDPGETPRQAARRETCEETGIHLDTLEKIAFYYPSPGASSEYYYTYLGLCDLAGVGTGLGGLAAENEDIRHHAIPFARLMQLVATHEANNAPLILSAHWLAANRARIRAQNGGAAPADGPHVR